MNVFIELLTSRWSFVETVKSTLLYAINVLEPVVLI